MAEISWDIAALDCATLKNGLSRVVTAVHWRCNGVDGDHVGSSYGSVGLADADPATFVPFDALTKDAVVAWAKAALGDSVAKIEAGIEAQIAASKAPTTVTPPLPWHVK